MFNLVHNIWCYPHLFNMCNTCTLKFKTNDRNAYLQLEEAFADKPGYEGVQLIGVRYGN